MSGYRPDDDLDDAAPDLDRAARDTGHVVVPTLIRDKSTLETLTSTLRTWTPFDQHPTSPTTATQSQAGPAVASSHSHPSSPKRSSHLASMYPHEVNHHQESSGERVATGSSGVGVEQQPREELDEQADGAEPEGESDGDRVVWGAWDTLSSDDAQGQPRRVLLMAYASAGFSIWDASHLDTWTEVLNIPSLDSVLGSLASKYPSGVGSILGACVLPTPTRTPSSTSNSGNWTESRPLVAILTRDNARPAASRVLLYSLRAHQVVHDVEIEGDAHRIACNKRFIVVSTTSPLALHVLSASTLHPTPFSPLTDVAGSRFDGAPVFDLGKGGRILAYASTTPVPTLRNDGEPARPGSGLLSQRGMFDSDHHDDPYGPASPPQNGFMGDGRTAGQVGGDVARRVGEGVLSGVKAIGDLGFSYWNARGGGGEAQASTSVAGKHFSKSAPLPSVPGFERRSPPLRPSASTRTSSSGETATSGTVIALDLLSYSPPSTTKPARRRPSRSAPPSGLKVVAHFRPYHHSIALLSLAPSSSLLLTASAQGHAFDVFEMKPAVPVGVSATEAERMSDEPSTGKVWHRYRLNRGYTSARTTMASWSSDLRFVGVGTGKGTTHIYAIQPFGGKPHLETHFAPKVTNAQELQPLSVSLSTISRIRRSSSPGNPDSFFSPPSLVFLPKADSHASSFRLSTPSCKAPPSPIPNRASMRSPRSPTIPFSHSSPSTAPTTTFQDCLLFYPQSGACVLDRLTTFPAPVSAEGAVAAASRGDVGLLATTAVSGLSQLMKTRGQSAVTPQVEFVVACADKAEWSVARQPGWGDVQDYFDVEGVGLPPVYATRFSAQAEIETFSRSPLVLPRSIYQSQQFDFFALPEHHLSQTSMGNFALPLRHLPMRSEVRVRQGDDSFAPSSDTTSPDLLGPDPDSIPASFDQPIKSAMQTILDSEAALVSRSPKTLTPTFPNGVAGKQGRWRDALPIRSVAPTVNEGLGRMRRELGRVRASAIVPRRRASSSGVYGAEATYSTSVSFEDDAVFADHAGSGSGEAMSTPGTSEQDELSDDALWGLDGLAEEEPLEEDGIELLGEDEEEEPPFEDDFEDDFVLDQPAAATQQGLGSSKETIHASAAPPAHAPAPHAPVPAQYGQKQPGMMAQMAANVGSVAAGSVIGHGISNMLFGGSSSHAAPVAAPEAPVQQQSFEERKMGGLCDIPAKDFTQCLNSTGNDMSACSWYLDQLKQCQQAAAQY
ncbi:WD40/YVTN repeat-like-containing domain containing protein [Pseudohyphozyma bogoriensis]|nr:WD40/YVTN repeat-like-containing domain containing protein [Pseudohyphozyma bogoriensis]